MLHGRTPQREPWIRIGRHETPKPGEERIFSVLAGLRDRAWFLWRDRYPDRAWDWHTLGAVRDPFGAWRVIEFERWSGFGVDAVPVLLDRIRYLPDAARIDPIDPPADPPVLIRASEVMPVRAIAQIHGCSDRVAARARDYLLDVERTLEARGLLSLPARTLSQWRKRLSAEGIRIYGRLPDLLTVDTSGAPSTWRADPGIR